MSIMITHFRMKPDWVAKPGTQYFRNIPDRFFIHDTFSSFVRNSSNGTKYRVNTIQCVCA